MAGAGMAADKIRFYLQYFTAIRKIKTFRKSHPDWVFPEPFMIYETFRLDYQRYFESGKADAQEIFDTVHPFMNLSDKPILEWGCGPGRIIRHFPELTPNAHLYGSDYNKEYITWCRKNLKGIVFEENKLSPPLPFEKGSLHFVYAISIFTHLSEEKHFEWINEMHRVLSVGGLFYFTTHGAITLQHLLPNESSKFEDGEIVVHGSVKEGYRMYTAYHPVPFIKKILSEKFEILKHIPGTQQPWGTSQDVWLVRNLG